MIELDLGQPLRHAGLDFEMNSSITFARTHDHWRDRGVISPWVHLAVGVFVSALGVFSICGNMLVVWTCTRFKDLRTRSNILIINLAVGDLLMCCIDFPLMAVASFLHTWPYGHVVCQVYAWITAVAGLVTINTLAAISVDRYWAVVRRATPEQRLSKRVTTLVALAVWGYSVAWALCPVLGWGSYILDGIGTTCTFDYLTRSWWNRSFVLAMAAGNFLLPFSLMVFCYTRIWAAVREVKRGLETDFPHASIGNGSISYSGGGGGGGKERQGSLFSTAGSTATKDSGLSLLSGFSSNSSKTSRSSTVSAGSISCDGKDSPMFSFSNARAALSSRLDGKCRRNSSILSVPNESCYDDTDLIKYDENRNKSPSSPTTPNFCSKSPAYSGPGQRFSVYFKRRPETVVTLGRRGHTMCGQQSSCRTMCGDVESSSGRFRSTSSCECHHRSNRPKSSPCVSRSIERGGPCRVAFKSRRTLKGSALVPAINDSVPGCTCGGSTPRHYGSGREARYGGGHGHRLSPGRTFNRFHSCCGTCSRTTNGTGHSLHCSSYGGECQEERRPNQWRRPSSSGVACNGERRCPAAGSSNASDTSRAKFKQRQHRLNCEHKTLRIILFLLLAFSIAWCPYLAVSLVGLFGDQSRISYLTSVLPSLVAKTSIVTNPILYSISHPKVRKRILTAILCRSRLSKPAHHMRLRTNQSSLGISNSQ